MSNSFCVLPFFGAEYTFDRSKTFCCLLPKDTDYEGVRNTMKNRQAPIECSICYNLEKQGIESSRQIQNRSYSFYSKKNLEQIENEAINGNYSPQIIKIYTSNICNSSCITCYPALSTKWQSIRKIQINKKIIDRSALGNVDWAQVKMLNFLGGEPLLEEENFAILENLLKVGNSKCFIGFVTNGSISLNKWQIELFKNFEFSNLCVSVDGIGKEFEYLRYPLNWQTVEQNLKVYHSVVKWVGISYTVSNLNILYYNKTTEWFRQNKLNNNHNIVKHPNFFNIENLPVNVKKDLPLIQETNSFDSNLFSSCIKEIEIQDKLKGINIKNYLPEVAKIFDDFRRENQKLFI